MAKTTDEVRLHYLKDKQKLGSGKTSEEVRLHNKLHGRKVPTAEAPAAPSPAAPPAQPPVPQRPGGAGE